MCGVIQKVSRLKNVFSLSDFSYPLDNNPAMRGEGEKKGMYFSYVPYQLCFDVEISARVFLDGSIVLAIDVSVRHHPAFWPKQLPVFVLQ